MGGFFEILLANIGGRILLGMLRAWDVRAYWLVVGALLAGLIVYLVWHKVRFETWFKAAPAEKQPSRAA